MLEFFQGEDGRLSMTRLLCFLAFFPATYLTIILGTETAQGIYLSTYALSYLGGKGFDAVTASKAEAVVETSAE